MPGATVCSAVGTVALPRPCRGLAVPPIVAAVGNRGWLRCTKWLWSGLLLCGSTAQMAG